jgi:hypothetical protein
MKKGSAAARRWQGGLRGKSGELKLNGAELFFAGPV